MRDARSPEPVRQLRVLRWGLVPSWAKTPEGAAEMINARAETVHEKPSFRRPFAARRCLLPADGYYEWVTGPQERQLEEQGKRKRPRKQPYFVTPADGSVMAMAGLYEFWRDRTLPDDHPRRLVGDLHGDHHRGGDRRRWPVRRRRRGAAARSPTSTPGCR